MSELDIAKRKAIGIAIEQSNKAILLPKHTTKVGAAIYTKDKSVYSAFNIQNHSHKSYHAEELAVLDCQLYGINPDKCNGIVITFSKNDLTNLTFACGHCRQMLWEFTKNPNFLVTEVTMDGKIIAEKTLGELYPMPYPYASMNKLNSKDDLIGTES